MYKHLTALTACTVLVASPALATTSAKPAGLFVISHKVADFAKWFPIYDADKPARDAAGLSDCKARQSVDDATQVVITCQMSDAAKAKAFVARPELKAKMTAAGVVSAPTFWYLNEGK
jgi:hypothetical protein